MIIGTLRLSVAQVLLNNFLVSQCLAVYAATLQRNMRDKNMRQRSKRFSWIKILMNTHYKVDLKQFMKHQRKILGDDEWQWELVKWRNLFVETRNCVVCKLNVNLNRIKALYKCTSPTNESYPPPNSTIF